MAYAVVLEDDPDRAAAMRAVLADLLPAADVLVFDNAPDAIAFLTVYAPQTLLISLDHDLGPSRVRDGAPFEPGDGRDVSAFLAARPPTGPVIVHSANYAMVMVMVDMLRRAGWPTTIVTPYSQLEHGWIEMEWRGEVARCVPAL
jgi:hypothetical protein